MIRPAAVFKNGMILQRNSVVRIWGESDAGSVEAEFCGKTYSAECRNDKWQLRIPTDATAGELSMRITAVHPGSEYRENLVISHILLGEVWLAGGQSNMEMELRNSRDGSGKTEEAGCSAIRFYNVPKVPEVNDELEEAESRSSWISAASPRCGEVSAVAWYVAHRLYERLQVPIGILGCYWGGTSATCWMDEASAEDIGEVKEYIEDWRKAINGTTDSEYDRQMADYNRRFFVWEKKTEELKRRNPDISWNEINTRAGQCPWPQPKGRKSPFRPFGIYESMIKRIAPYGIRGILYYQGEEDADKAEYYCKLNSAVVRRWRQDFCPDGKNPNTLPFYITQLPMYAASLDEDDKSWCVLRQQQELCARVNENVYLTVLIDYGEFNNIHPVNKRIPGQRIADNILKRTYGRNDIPGHMRLESILFSGNSCRLTFADTYGFLCIRKSDGFSLTAESDENIPVQNDHCKDILGFEVSLDGEEFQTPEIQTEGESIILSIKKNKKITMVRYGWSNYGVANLYNGRGKPLAPFYVRKED